MTDMVNIIEQSRDLSVSNTKRENLPLGALPVIFMAQMGLQMTPWWSPARDIQLRNFWKKVDYLAGAVYTLEAKMSSIPFKVIPRNTSIREHVLQAEHYTELLYATPQFGEGWSAFLVPFLEDLLTTDNGAFAEVVGYGPKDGPIIGTPLTVVQLDSLRCVRTGSSEYPVLYRDDVDGKLHKLHYSRVMYGSQMPSPIKEMYRVGVCAVSRCVNVSQSLLDVLTFKQEKLGSRPHRAIIVPSGGLDPSDVQSAFQMAENSMDSMGLTRYSKIVVAGSSSLPEAKLDVVSLSELPDGFDERTSTELGMAAVALAFGVDARELFPSSQTGATRAEALLQHLKQRGKGPGQIIQTIEKLFDQKFLPPHLQMVFDFQDDAQDRQVADIRKVRADSRLQDMSTGVMDERTMREQMLEAGDLTRPQFERMELIDGRLPDGSSVLILFYSDDATIKKMLDIGTDDPLNSDENDEAAMLQAIHEKLVEAQVMLANESNEIKRAKEMQAIAALVYLQNFYSGESDALATSFGFKRPVQPADPNRIDKRTRKDEPTNANEAELQSQRGSSMQDVQREEDEADN